jgi:hypothetical protein
MGFGMPLPGIFTYRRVAGGKSSVFAKEECFFWFEKEGIL